MKKNAIEELKSRSIMYTNQLENIQKLGLPIDKEALFEHFSEVYQPIDIAIILHDSDLNAYGEKQAKHYHIAMRFDNPRHLTALASEINDHIHNFSIKKGSNYKSMFSYLCHRTKTSEHKFQYNPHSVRANFNYPQWLSQVSGEVSTTRKTQIKRFLNEFGIGDIGMEEIKILLTPYEFAENKRKIDVIHELILDKNFEKFKEMMIANGEEIQSYYLFGDTGTGKTRFAKEKFDGEYYITGSNRDLFAGYTNQNTVIIDELRPDSISYNELLKLLDPFNFENVAGSRYFDKKLCAKNRVITTPYNPEDFYHEIKNGGDIQIIETRDKQTTPEKSYEKPTPDKKEQFFRRISVFRFEYDYIIPMHFNDKTGKFEDINLRQIENKWSEEITFKTKYDLLSVADNLFEGDSQ
ncbi:Rep family protein [uncultured Enterococcus sp.]|uniref:Rep family protein n=1 Tax=uncultured Enterococcus sp. TaxID=167972 RepID=UPI002AA79E45|nr:Rep family protein [uncultured Enterococcus sp.]